METINLHFNEAWVRLAEHFPSANLPGGISLALDKKPTVSQKEWKNLASALINVIGIGLRNGWLETHVDYGGRPLLLYVRDADAHPGAEEKHQ